ncbi:uncharacterized protein LOC130742258 [Lotus japonicus]|uniref:uncharacterized protein LOC130742258 n=1 Tax=Lotus japonicus TaxID=34305 RepID=UPI002585AD3B|nr:uncharacterized protein LOC130742258 [Lotus japonicus]
MSGTWVTWNVRGLGRAEKRKSVRLALERVRPELVLLQETKLNDDREGSFRGWLNAGMEVVCVPAVHSPGGLATLWRRDIFNNERVIKGNGFLFVQLRIQSSGEVLFVGNVYGPQDVTGRVRMFEELGREVEGMEGRIVVGGDYNAILNDGERQGVAVDTRGEGAFKDFVLSNFLIDLPMQNGDFTWGSTRGSGLWSRLDRWLINEDALLGFD